MKQAEFMIVDNSSVERPNRSYGISNNSLRSEWIGRDIQLHRFPHIIDPRYTLQANDIFLRLGHSNLGDTFLHFLLENVGFSNFDKGWVRPDMFIRH